MILVIFFFLLLSRAEAPRRLSSPSRRFPTTPRSRWTACTREALRARSSSGTASERWRSRKPFYTQVTFTESIGAGSSEPCLFLTARVSQTPGRGGPRGPVSWALGDFQRNPEIPQITLRGGHGATDESPGRTDVRFSGQRMLVVTNESQLEELLLAAAARVFRGHVPDPVFVRESRCSIPYNLNRNMTTFPSWLLLMSLERHRQQACCKPLGPAVPRGYREASPSTTRPGSLRRRAAGGRLLVSGARASGPFPRGTSSWEGTTTWTPLESPSTCCSPTRCASTRSTSAHRSHERPVTSLSFGRIPTGPRESAAACRRRDSSRIRYLSDWLNGRPPAGQEDLPVTSVSWHAAVALYRQWLTPAGSRPPSPGTSPGCPRESEWEWAARGGLRGMPYPLGGEARGRGVLPQGDHRAVRGRRLGAERLRASGHARERLGVVRGPVCSHRDLLSSLDPRGTRAMRRALPDGPTARCGGGCVGNQSEHDQGVHPRLAARRLVHAVPRVQGRAGTDSSRPGGRNGKVRGGSRSSGSTRRPGSTTRSTNPSSAGSSSSAPRSSPSRTGGSPSRTPTRWWRTTSCG